jgi:hypothetical protein
MKRSCANCVSNTLYAKTCMYAYVLLLLQNATQSLLVGQGDTRKKEKNRQAKPSAISLHTYN